eukprot:m.143109 g.143109  ORF g.143109 m.143109 type:complete len:68 (+) comp16010_c0_seq1:2192-2395(+)
MMQTNNLRRSCGFAFDTLARVGCETRRGRLACSPSASRQRAPAGRSVTSLSGDRLLTTVDNDGSSSG